MVKQYPYILRVLRKSDATHDPDTGEWSTGDGMFRFHAKCRDEKSSSGDRVITVDGEVYNYNWIVYMPKGTHNIPIGATVRVVDVKENIRLEAKALRFSKDQLHCRLWL